MHKNRVIFFLTLKSGSSASPEVSDLGKTGPEFSQVSMLPKPAHLPSTGLSSLAGQTPALSQTQILRPTAPHWFSTHQHTHSVIYSFIYLKRRKAGTSLPLCVWGKWGRKQARQSLWHALSSLPAFLTLTCPEDLQWVTLWWLCPLTLPRNDSPRCFCPLFFPSMALVVWMS